MLEFVHIYTALSCKVKASFYEITYRLHIKKTILAFSLFLEVGVSCLLFLVSREEAGFRVYLYIVNQDMTCFRYTVMYCIGFNLK